MHFGEHAFLNDISSDEEDEKDDFIFESENVSDNE